MEFDMKAVFTLALGLAIAACAPSVSPHQARRTEPHASREEALQLLRHEGILPDDTRVLSAVWHEDISEWLITLRPPSGTQSGWLVDAAARNYQGGTCSQ